MAMLCITPLIYISLLYFCRSHHVKTPFLSRALHHICLSFQMFHTAEKAFMVISGQLPAMLCRGLISFFQKKKKNYPKDQSHKEITEITIIPNTASLVIVQKTKCKIWGPCFTSQSVKNFEAILGMAYKLLKPKRHLSEKTPPVC